jgi:hypothetical protein
LEVGVKILHPDEKRAHAYAEHVVSILIDNDMCDTSVASDATLKNVLALWLTFLSEVLKEDFDDASYFIETALLHQRVLVGLAEENWQKGSLDGSAQNPRENAKALSFWNPVLLPVAAFYLTDDNQIPGNVYSTYWTLIATKRMTEFFPRLPLDMLVSQMPSKDEKALRIFTADMRQLTLSLLADHYEAAYRLGLKGDDPDKFTNQLFETWEGTWLMISDFDAQEIDTQTMRLHFLLKNLGYLLASKISEDFAKSVAVLIDERTKHGWHGFCPKIDA